MKESLQYQDILDAAARIRPYLPPTPLRTYALLNETLGCRVLVKHENFQPSGAFKIRNTLSALTALEEYGDVDGVIAATRGNHGIGLALAGQQLGIPVTICVPEVNSLLKNRVIQSLGATLIRAGQDYDETLAIAEAHGREHRLAMIHGTNDRRVLAGAGTLTLEALAQAEQQGEAIDAMFFAIAGGSEAVGALTVLQARQMAIPVIGVQAAAAPAAYDSFHGGQPVERRVSPTLADGLATRCTYEMAFDVLRRGLDDMLQIEEPEIADTMRLILQQTSSLVEGAAAVGLAGLRQVAGRFRDKTVMVVFTGANLDWSVLQRVVCNGAGG